MRRRVGCLATLLTAVAFSVACLPVTSAVRAPVLDEAGATAVLLAADAARVAAFAAADPGPLRAVFADSAIAPLLPELTRLHRRGERVEERDSSRRLVHWSSSAGLAEGVLEVAGEQRAGSGDDPGRAWSRIVRQWSAAVHWSGARWLVVEARDLPPPQWWHS
jgi:hypothetical protein